MKRHQEHGKSRLGNPGLAERVHDPYRAEAKLPEPTRCPDCGAVYSEGRWRWAEAPAGAHESRCPACRRIEDGYPAGELILSGAFVHAHEAELLGLVRNEEAAERREHPLHRIMGTERRSDGLRLTTTDIHLPRRIGHALEAAWDGELTTHYDEQGYSARVVWTRED